jgi:hypothetical protein
LAGVNPDDVCFWRRNDQLLFPTALSSCGKPPSIAAIFYDNVRTRGPYEPEIIFFLPRRQTLKPKPAFASSEIRRNQGFPSQNCGQVRMSWTTLKSIAFIVGSSPLENSPYQELTNTENVRCGHGNPNTKRAGPCAGTRPLSTPHFPKFYSSRSLTSLLN